MREHGIRSTHVPRRRDPQTETRVGIRGLPHVVRDMDALTQGHEEPGRGRPADRPVVGVTEEEVVCGIESIVSRCGSHRGRMPMRHPAALPSAVSLWINHPVTDEAPCRGGLLRP